MINLSLFSIAKIKRIKTVTDLSQFQTQNKHLRNEKQNGSLQGRVKAWAKCKLLHIEVRPPRT